MTTLLLNARTFAELFPPEPPTAPMPVEVTRYDGPRPPPPPPEAFEDEAPAPMPQKAPARPRGKRKAPRAPEGPDPRLPSNLEPHRWANDGLQRRTPAQRRKLMAACPCRLCALALRPPLTFADAERFGVGEVGSRWQALRESMGWKDAGEKREKKEPKKKEPSTFRVLRADGSEVKPGDTWERGSDRYTYNGVAFGPNGARRLDVMIRLGMYGAEVNRHVDASVNGLRIEET